MEAENEYMRSKLCTLLLEVKLLVWDRKELTRDFFNDVNSNGI